MQLIDKKSEVKYNDKSTSETSITVLEWGAAGAADNIRTALPSGNEEHCSTFTMTGTFVNDIFKNVDVVVRPPNKEMQTVPAGPTNYGSGQQMTWGWSRTRANVIEANDNRTPEGGLEYKNIIDRGGRVDGYSFHYLISGSYDMHGPVVEKMKITFDLPAALKSKMDVDWKKPD